MNKKLMEAEEVCVCIRKDQIPPGMYLPDNTEGPCEGCGALLTFRNNIPASMVKVCMQCGAERMKNHVDNNEEFQFIPKDPEDCKAAYGLTDEELKEATKKLFEIMVPTGTKQ